MRSPSRSTARSSRRLLVLAAVAAVCTLGLMQPAAFAAGTPPPQPFGLNAQIQTSNDNSTWTTIYSATTGTGGTQTLNVAGSGRYIRMYGTARATQYGYSIYEFQVYPS
jgi:F5/8 type C domain